MVLLVLSQAPLLYNPLLQFSQCKLHLSVSCRLISQRCPCLALLQLYLRTHTNSIRPENDSACRRRGAACGVFTSGTWILQVRGSCWGHILGVGARQQRRSLVHAVGGHVVDREKWRVAPGCTEFSLSTEEQPAAGCWCRLAPVQQQQQPRWRKPGGGWSSAVVPAPLRYGPGHGQSSCWCTLKEFFYFFLINCIDLKSVFHLIPQIHFYSYLSLRIITTWLKSKRDDKVWEFKWWDKKKQQLTAVATRCHCGITEVRGSAVRARSPHILLFIHGCGVRFTQQSPAELCFLCRPGVANSFYNMEDHEYQN